MTLAEALASKPELAGEAFNFSNELQISVVELVERILAAMGSSSKPDVRNHVSNEIKRQYLSALKARNLLEWEPLFTLESGLDRTIAWYRSFFSQ